GLFGEFLRIRQPLVFVALDETLPAQYAQLRARLGLEGQLLCHRFAREHRCAKRGAGRGGCLQEMTSCDSGHAASPLCRSGNPGAGCRIEQITLALGRIQLDGVTGPECMARTRYRGNTM